MLAPLKLVPPIAVTVVMRLPVTLARLVACGSRVAGGVAGVAVWKKLLVRPSAVNAPTRRPVRLVRFQLVARGICMKTVALKTPQPALPIAVNVTPMTVMAARLVVCGTRMPTTAAHCLLQLVMLIAINATPQLVAQRVARIALGTALYVTKQQLAPPIASNALLKLTAMPGRMIASGMPIQASVSKSKVRNAKSVMART